MEQQQYPVQKKRLVSIAEAIGFAISLLGIIIVFYTQTQVRLNSLELRMGEKEKSDQIFIDQFDKINNKLDRMQLEIFDIKLQVQTIKPAK